MSANPIGPTPAGFKTRTLVAVVATAMLLLGAPSVARAGFGDHAASYSVGSGAGSVALGDFNGDGKADLATASWAEDLPYSHDVSVLLGNGDGTFATAVYYEAGSSPISVAVGDFDADSNSDLVVANQGSANVSVLLGNGDGTFATAVPYGAGLYPTSVAIGDFNADTKVDLAVSDRGVSPDYQGRVSIRLGAGDGTFAAPTNYLIDRYAGEMAVVELNGDAEPDLVVGTSASVSVLLGNGDGTFAAAVNYAHRGGNRMTVGDLNGDSHPDVVAGSGDFRYGGLSVLLGNGDGSFAAAVDYWWRLGAGAIHDFNGDGLGDLAATSSNDYWGGSPDSLKVLLGEILPTINIRPYEGPKGTLVTLAGIDFTPGETVSVKYKTGLDAPKSVFLCSGTTAANSAFSCQGTIPQGFKKGPLGSHTIVVKGLTSLAKVKTVFNLIPKS